MRSRVQVKAVGVAGLHLALWVYLIWFYAGHSFVLPGEAAVIFLAILCYPYVMLRETYRLIKLDPLVEK